MIRFANPPEADPVLQLECIKIRTGDICYKNQTLQYLKIAKITTLQI